MRTPIGRSLGRWRSRQLTAAVVVAACISIPASGSAVAASGPVAASVSNFYAYTGARPLATIAPGTILKHRTITAHLQGLPLPISVTQLLYRTVDGAGRPAITVTSLMHPVADQFPMPRLISYQNAYDSLTPQCQPSTALAGGTSPWDLISDSTENAQIVTFLMQGYTVSTSDYEGENQAFLMGTLEGHQTLDGIRAVLHLLPRSTRVGMIGYSGGAVATEFAAELLARYAPDLRRRVVGTALGGLMVDPIHNLRYISGSPLWSGPIPAGLDGYERGYGVDLTKYMTPRGKQLMASAENTCIAQVFGSTPGLTLKDIVSPRYGGDLANVPVLVRILNSVIMGRHGTPSNPLFIGQGDGGQLEGTPEKPGFGPGDGVIIVGDVRALARQYCARGVPVAYQQYRGLSHIVAQTPFESDAQTWLDSRFAGHAPTSSCGHIAPGNSIAPLPIRNPRVGR